MSTRWVWMGSKVVVQPKIVPLCQQVEIGLREGWNGLGRIGAWHVQFFLDSDTTGEAVCNKRFVRRSAVITLRYKSITAVATVSDPFPTNCHETQC